MPLVQEAKSVQMLIIHLAEVPDESRLNKDC